MIDYFYVAKNKDGELIKGNIAADNPKSAAKTLTDRGFFPISILEKSSGYTFFEKISTKDKVMITRQLSTMINAGLPIAKALAVLSEQTSSKVASGMLQNIAKEVEGGSSLSAAFKNYPKLFRPIDISLIESGETSGTLDKVMGRLADTIESEAKINSKIKGAFGYPAFLSIVVIAIIILMVTYVTPQMGGLYADFDATLPLVTRWMLSFSDFIIHSGWIVLIVGVLLAVSFRYYIGTVNGRYAWDKIKLNIPLVKIFLQKVYTARFARTLSGLVFSGVPLLDSLKIVSTAVGNKVYEEEILHIRQRVKNGVPLSRPIIESKLFTPIVGQMISVGEETGQIDKMLESLAGYFEEEVDNFVKNFSSLLEPIIIVVMGGIVLFIMIAIMLPIYGLTSVIS